MRAPPLSLILSAVLLLPAGGPSARAQDIPDAGPASAAQAPAAARVHVHFGAFEGDTVSARTMAPEVADHAARLARLRPVLHVTEDPLRSWTDPSRIRHEGELLRCMDPWVPKAQVLSCLRALDFPAPPPRPPGDAQFLVRGSLRPGDKGMAVSATLAPFLRGEPGPLVMSRTVEVPYRATPGRKEKLMAELFDPLLDAAEGKPPPPPKAPPRRKGRG